MLTAAETVLYNTSSTGPIRKFLTVIAPAVGRLGILLEQEGWLRIKKISRSRL